jgi:hypothetical protein
MSASTVYLRNLLESKNILDRALLMNQSFPCSPFHSGNRLMIYGNKLTFCTYAVIMLLLSSFIELQKQKAEKLLKDNEFHNGFAHLVDSHCVSLRHAAVNAHRDKLAKKKISKSNTVALEGNEDSKAIHQLDQSFQFTKANFPKFLYSLPPEWTIIHISEIWQGYESLKMQGFGPPPIAYSLPKLIIARFHGGHTGSLLTKFIDQPAGGLSGESLLAELHSILEGNRTVNKDFRGNRDMYWKLKQEHHDQLKVR